MVALVGLQCVIVAYLGQTQLILHRTEAIVFVLLRKLSNEDIELAVQKIGLSGYKR